MRSSETLGARALRRVPEATLHRGSLLLQRPSGEGVRVLAGATGIARGFLRCSFCPPGKRKDSRPGPHRAVSLSYTLAGLTFPIISRSLTIALCCITFTLPSPL